MNEEDARLMSPAVARNKEVIADAFDRNGVVSGKILEVGAGTGEHAIYMLKRFADLVWTGVEPDPSYRSSCEAWAKSTGLEHRFKVLDRNLLDHDWAEKIPSPDFVFCANVFHISPIGVMNSFFNGISRFRSSLKRIVLYGPYKRSGILEPQSNRDFDLSLRSRNADWGIRDLDKDITPVAERSGFRLARVEHMPANNDLVVFEA